MSQQAEPILATLVRRLPPAPASAIGRLLRRVGNGSTPSW